MVLQLFIGLMALAVVSLLITQGRRRKIWSALLLLGLATVSYFFMESLNHESSSGFIYQWLPYDVLKADFNISSSLRTQKLIFPLVVLLGALVYLNTLFREEIHSLRINTLMLLNFVALILLISSHDFLQLMFADCVVALISFYLVDLPKPKKNMFVFNFLAEMLIFIAFSVIYGKVGSISFSHLPEFVSNGEHQTLAVIMILVAIGCKSGLFLINGQYFSLKDVSLNRLSCLLTLSQPLAGSILLSKTKVLFSEISWMPSLISYWCVISVATALLLCIVNKDIRTKTIASCLALYPIALSHIYENPENLYLEIPYFLFAGLLLNLIMMLVIKGSSGETDTSCLGGFWRLTKVNFLLVLIMLAVISALLIKVSISPKDVITFAGVMGVTALNLKIVYMGKSRANEKVTAFASSVGIFYWLPLLCFFYWLMVTAGILHNISYYKLLGVIVFVMLVVPSGALIKLGQIFSWQGDALLSFYEIIFIRPLRIMGRILWLAFDVVMIERNIIGGISALTGTTVDKLHYWQNENAKSFWLSISFGVIALLVYFGSLFYE